jgi:uncharacterized protein YbjT (DUF2867 family)
MTRILITGGNGMLGRALTDPLQKEGYTVRVASRGARAANAKSGVEWAQIALETGEGLDEALKDVDIVLHCATGGYNKAKLVDVEGTKRLMALAKQHHIKHLLFISIIGVDKIPNPFMQAKLDAEQIIEASGVPYTILRAAQFYGEFITPLLKIVTKPPVGLIPKGFRYQPIDIQDVAAYMVELVKAGPSGHVPDIAGPRTYELVDLARTWLQAQGKHKPLLQIPVPGKFGAATRAGYGTSPQNARKGLTWEAWLQRQYSAGS